MSMISALVCAADHALRRETKQEAAVGGGRGSRNETSSHALNPTSRKTKRNETCNGLPYKRTLSDVSSCSTQEDIDLVDFEWDDETSLECTPSDQDLEEKESPFIPPAPSPEKCARNARAKMVLILMDTAELEEKEEAFGVSHLPEGLPQH